MNPERWRQIDQLLEAALEREPEERAAFLALACEDDESLRRQVESRCGLMKRRVSQTAACSRARYCAGASSRSFCV
jgi:hypothetical protein